MNGHDICAVLGNLPENMVAEAMKRPARSISWLRIAVCAAMVLGLLCGMIPSDPEIVTAPGLLTIKVYAKETDGSGYVVKELDKGIDAAVKHENECIIDGQPVDPIGISLYFSVASDEYPSDEITYRVSAERGNYFDYSSGDYIKNLNQKFELKNPSFVSWHPMFSLDDDPNARVNPKYDHVYTDVVITCRGYIIGYAVLRFDREYIEIEENGESRWIGTTNYEPYLITSVMFPKQDGFFQYVTEDYVSKSVQQIKDRDRVN